MPILLGRIGDRRGDEFTAFLVSYLGKPAANGTLNASPYVYGLVDTHRGQFFDGLKRRVMPIGAEVELPGRLNQYLEPGTDWGQAFDAETRPPRQYKAGTTTQETFEYKP